MLAGLLLVLVLLPLALLLPLLVLAGKLLAAILVGLAAALLLPAWLLLAYVLLVRWVEPGPDFLALRAGPWRLRVARSALRDEITRFAPLDDRLHLADRRISGIRIAALAVGRFRHPDGGWVFKLLTGPGEALRLGDAAGNRIEFSPRDPEQFLAAWSATAQGQ